MKIETNSSLAPEQSLLTLHAQSFENEIKDYDITGLKLVMQKLNFLSFEVDPYDISQLKTEEKNILEEFKLSQFMENPFDYTNIILRMIDLVENEINKNYH